MGKTARIVCACGVIYMLSFGLSAAVTGTGGNEVTAVTVEAKADVAPTAETTYIIKEREGMVAVFESGSGRPITETDIAVSGLRSQDRELVAEGIRVENYSEVLCLLEDLGS